MIYNTIIILIFDNKNKNILKQTRKTNETNELIKSIKKEAKKIQKYKRYENNITTIYRKVVFQLGFR
jgi:hypothetical protein